MNNSLVSVEVVAVDGLEHFAGRHEEDGKAARQPVTKTASETVIQLASHPHKP